MKQKQGIKYYQFPYQNVQRDQKSKNYYGDIDPMEAIVTDTCVYGHEPTLQMTQFGDNEPSSNTQNLSLIADFPTL